MQQQKHSWQTRRLLTRQSSLPVLLGAAALLAILGVAGWGSARAAPLDGGPTLNIISFDGNTLTLKFANWATGQSVTLGYSASRTCSPAQSLPNATFSITTDPFITNYIWPSTGIQPGTYYLCATGAVEGTIASQQTITVNRNGTIQSTPGVTPTRTGGSATPTRAGGSSSATPTPGNGGISTPSTNTAPGNTLVAIILLCLLVMALLAYLIRLWLQGRQPSGQPPAGGGGAQGP
jgi:hypothetical protein